MGGHIRIAPSDISADRTGCVASGACGAASAEVVWALAARRCVRGVADIGVMLFCLCPGALIFATLCTRPLAVALAAPALAPLLGRRWLLAGTVGAIGTAE